MTTAYDRRIEVARIIHDALEIEGKAPTMLGYACMEVTVEGQIVRIDIVVPSKPWTVAYRQGNA